MTFYVYAKNGQVNGGPPPAPWIRHCSMYDFQKWLKIDGYMLRGVWQALNSLSIDPCNIYRDGPRGVGYPADSWRWPSFVLVDVCVVSTVCRRLLLQQRPTLNLNVNCRTLICRLFKDIILIVRPRLIVHKRLYLYSPVHTINLSVFSLFIFTVFNSCFKFYMNMNMNIRHLRLCRWLGGLLVERRTSVSQILGSIPSQVAAV